MSDVTPRLHLVAQGAEGGTLPSEYVVVAGDDGTDIHPLQLTASGDLLVSLGGETLDVSGATVTVETELPAAAALTDDFANPTAPGVGAFGMLWDGATWDRMKGDATDGVLVNLGTNNDVSITGSLPAGSNEIGGVDIVDALFSAGEGTALPTELVVVAGDDGTDTHPLQVAADGDLKVTLDSEEVALAAGTNNIGDVDVLTAPYSDGFGGASGEPSEAVLISGTNNTDTYALLCDTNGRLSVDINSGGGGPEDTDDDVVAGGQTAALGIALGYGWDGTQWERLTTDASGSLDVNVTLALPAGDNNIGNVDIVTAPTGASAIEVQGTAADGASVAGDPVQVGGKDGSGNAQTLLTDTDGHLQVDILSGAGSSAPTNPTIDTDSSTDTAAAGTANLDSAEITEAEKLYSCVVSAGVAFKFKVVAVEDGTPRDLSNLMFGAAGETVEWKPPHIDFAVHAGAAAGTDVFRAVVTNMDNQAADLHATFYYGT
jgi:hypothetical protein